MSATPTRGTLAVEGGLATSYETVLFEVDDRIATVTLNRPERMNAWNDQLANDLSEALRRCDEDDGIRAVVVTGAGRAFCAGAEMGATGETFARQGRDAEAVERQEWLRQRARERGGYAGLFPFEIRKPVFAAINGHAIGVGITWPMTCDVRFVAEDAKVQFAFTRRGVLPELWSHLIVSRVAGLSNASDLLLTGRMISGRELARMGLASAALPADQVLAATRERAREVLAAAPVSVALSKRLLWRGLSAGFEELGREEVRLFNWISQQPDAREGVLHFFEKREPEWKLSVARDTPDSK
jgi:enoyl-CoA hydratase/carnithine racemase